MLIKGIFRQNDHIVFSSQVIGMESDGIIQR